MMEVLGEVPIDSNFMLENDNISSEEVPDLLGDPLELPIPDKGESRSDDGAAEGVVRKRRQQQHKVPNSYPTMSITEFSKEMLKNIHDIVHEAIWLGKDPWEYHPFYLRVYKYITIGQRHGYVSRDTNIVNNIWKSFFKYAEDQYKRLKNETTIDFIGEKSPYANFILTKNVRINGILVRQIRNHSERHKMFRSLEQSIELWQLEWKIKNGKKVGGINCPFRNDLGIRLRFFDECKQFTFPGDVLKMNDLWTKLLGAQESTKKSIDSTITNSIIRGQVSGNTGQRRLQTKFSDGTGQNSGRESLRQLLIKVIIVPPSTATGGSSKSSSASDDLPTPSPPPPSPPTCISPVCLSSDDEDMPIVIESFVSKKPNPPLVPTPMMKAKPEKSQREQKIRKRKLARKLSPRPLTTQTIVPPPAATGASSKSSSASHDLLTPSPPASPSTCISPVCLSSNDEDIPVVIESFVSKKPNPPPLATPTGKAKHVESEKEKRKRRKLARNRFPHKTETKPDARGSICIQKTEKIMLNPKIAKIPGKSGVKIDVLKSPQLQMKKLKNKRTKPTNEKKPVEVQMEDNPLGDPLELRSPAEKDQRLEVGVDDVKVVPKRYQEYKVVRTSYQNMSITEFAQEMETNIYDIVHEAIWLGTVPWKYHPFYLRVYKYITTGQRLGYVSADSTVATNIWEALFKFAEDQYKWFRNENRATIEFTGEKSPYANFLLTRKVYINGVVVQQKRNHVERHKMFRSLEQSIELWQLEWKIKNSKKVGGINCPFRNDLAMRLRFFNECKLITFPGDVLMMNNLWSKLLREEDDTSTKKTSDDAMSGLAQDKVNDASSGIEMEGASQNRGREALKKLINKVIIVPPSSPATGGASSKPPLSPNSNDESNTVGDGVSKKIYKNMSPNIRLNNFENTLEQEKRLIIKLTRLTQNEIAMYSRKNGNK